MSKKIQLDNIQVQSFVTQLPEGKAETVQGGASRICEPTGVLCPSEINCGSFPPCYSDLFTCLCV